MKIRVNILSGTPGTKLDWVSGLSAAVPVFHTSLAATHPIGTASDYQIEGADLWAMVEVPESCPSFARAVAMLDGSRLAAVIVTNFSQQQIIDLMGGRSSGTTGRLS